MDFPPGSLRPGGLIAARALAAVPDLDDDPYDTLMERELRGVSGLSLFEQIVKQCGENFMQMHVRGKDGDFVPVPYKQVFDDAERDFLEDHGANFVDPEEESVFPHRPFYSGYSSGPPHAVGETFDVPVPVEAVVAHVDGERDAKKHEFFPVGGAEIAVTAERLVLQVPELVGAASMVAINPLGDGGTHCEFSNNSVSLKFRVDKGAQPGEQVFSALEMLEKCGVDFSPLRKQFDEVLYAAVFSAYEVDHDGVFHVRPRSVGREKDPFWPLVHSTLSTIVSHLRSLIDGTFGTYSIAWAVTKAIRSMKFGLKDLRACVDAANVLARQDVVMLGRVHSPDPSAYVRRSLQTVRGFVNLLPRVRRRSVAYVPRSAKDFEALLVICAAYGIPVERRHRPDCSRPILMAVSGSTNATVDRLGIVALDHLFAVEVIDGSFTKRYMPLYRYIRPRDVALGQYMRLHYTRTRLVVASMCTIQRSVDDVVRVVTSPERCSPGKYAPYARIVCAFLSGNVPAPSQWSYYAYYRGPDPKLEMYPVLSAFTDDFVSDTGVDSERAPESGSPLATFVAYDLAGRRPVPLPAVIGLAHI